MESLIEGVDHPAFTTNNLDEIEQFYCGVLGLKIGFVFLDDEGKRYGFFIDTPNGTRLEFFQSVLLPPAFGRLRHIAFKVSDVLKQADVLRLAGYTPGEIKRGKKDKVLQFFVEDPQGNVIEFQQFDEQSIR